MKITMSTGRGKKRPWQDSFLFQTESVFNCSYSHGYSIKTDSSIARRILQLMPDILTCLLSPESGTEITQCKKMALMIRTVLHSEDENVFEFLNGLLNLPPNLEVTSRHIRKIIEQQYPGLITCLPKKMAVARRRNLGPSSTSKFSPNPLPSKGSFNSNSLDETQGQNNENHLVLKKFKLSAANEQITQQNASNMHTAKNMRYRKEKTQAAAKKEQRSNKENIQVVFKKRARTSKASVQKYIRPRTDKENIKIIDVTAQKANITEEPMHTDSYDTEGSSKISEATITTMPEQQADKIILNIHHRGQDGIHVDHNAGIWEADEPMHSDGNPSTTNLLETSETTKFLLDGRTYLDVGSIIFGGDSSNTNIHKNALSYESSDVLSRIRLIGDPETIINMPESKVWESNYIEPNTLSKAWNFLKKKASTIWSSKNVKVVVLTALVSGAIIITTYIALQSLQHGLDNNNNNDELAKNMPRGNLFKIIPCYTGIPGKEGTGEYPYTLEHVTVPCPK